MAGRWRPRGRGLAELAATLRAGHQAPLRSSARTAAIEAARAHTSARGAGPGAAVDALVLVAASGLEQRDWTLFEEASYRLIAEGMKRQDLVAALAHLSRPLAQLPDTDRKQLLLRLEQHAERADGAAAQCRDRPSRDGYPAGTVVASPGVAARCVVLSNADRFLFASGGFDTWHTADDELAGKVSPPGLPRPPDTPGVEQQFWNRVRVCDDKSRLRLALEHAGKSWQQYKGEACGKMAVIDHYDADMSRKCGCPWWYISLSDAWQFSVPSTHLSPAADQCSALLCALIAAADPSASGSSAVLGRVLDTLSLSQGQVEALHQVLRTCGLAVPAAVLAAFDNYPPWKASGKADKKEADSDGDDETW